MSSHLPATDGATTVVLRHCGEWTYLHYYEMADGCSTAERLMFPTPTARGCNGTTGADVDHAGNHPAWRFDQGRY